MAGHLVLLLALTCHCCTVVLSQTGEEAQSQCSYNKWRTINGSYTNPCHKDWGTAAKPYITLINQTKKTDFDLLPKTREIATTLFPLHEQPDQLWTLLSPAWGQMVAHDILISQSVTTGCCTTGNQFPSTEPPHCSSIRVSKDDKLIPKDNDSCIAFYRALPLGKDTQVNMNTPSLDASHIYGSDEALAQRLRTLNKGLMATRTEFNNKSFLPLDEKPFLPCGGSKCHLCGDVRCNQQVMIAMLQVIMVRFHNLVSGKLFELNPCWGDERLYQETRRFVEAALQLVTYKHYLPIILGKDYAEKHGLIPECSKECKNDFNENVNVAITKEFSFACFRTLHYSIPNEVYKMDANYSKIGSELLWKTYNQIDPLEATPTAFTEYFRALFGQPMKKQEPSQSKAVGLRLFQNQNASSGGDLASLDTRRNWDVEVPQYLELYQFSQKNKSQPLPKKFEELNDVMSKKNWRLLETVYKDIQKVSLYSGGTYETVVPGGQVGPTCQYVIMKQFWNLKYGDYFHFENCHNNSLTTAQKLQICNLSPAWMMCAVEPDILNIPRDPFSMVSEKNPIVSCEDIQGPDFTPWMDTQCDVSNTIADDESEES